LDQVRVEGARREVLEQARFAGWAGVTRQRSRDEERIAERVRRQCSWRFSPDLALGFYGRCVDVDFVLVEAFGQCSKDASGRVGFVA
jgi:hypothetical protein